jgi:hypothetical protein
VDFTDVTYKMDALGCINIEHTNLKENVNTAPETSVILNTSHALNTSKEIRL